MNLTLFNNSNSELRYYNNCNNNTDNLTATVAASHNLDKEYHNVQTHLKKILFGRIRERERQFLICRDDFSASKPSVKSSV